MEDKDNKDTKDTKDTKETKDHRGGKNKGPKLPDKLPVFLKFANPCVGDEETAELADTIRSGWITNGPKTQKFEGMAASHLKAESSLAVSSCTAALHLALRALGVGPGDGVVTTPLTFVSTVHSILYAGAHPFFCDIDSKTGNLNPDSARDFLIFETKKTWDGVRVHKETGKKIKCLLPVHYGGDPLELKLFKDLAAEFNLHILEDAAHAFGSYIGEDAIGSAKLTATDRPDIHNFVAFSLYATKNLTAAEGGLLVGDSKDLLEDARVLSAYGISDARRIWGRYGPKGTHDYDVEVLGFKNNFTDIGAAIAIAQLNKFPEMQAKRKLFAETYREAFKPLGDQVILPEEREGTTNAWHLFPLRLNLKALKVGRDDFIDILNNHNIGSSVMFIPVHHFTYYKKLLTLANNAFPNTLQFYRSEVSLPMSPKEDIETIREAASIIADLLRYYAM
jgi:dTDP-4-amino-4,6-dideoxygalactose transaminase